MSVHIITDSSSDIVNPSDPRLTVVPLSIAFGTKTYADGVDLSHEQFYELLVEGDDMPTTGQATPYAFSQAIEAARKDADGIVVITLSSKLSGTYESAVAAADGASDVYVVDSKNVTVGQCILVDYALRLADEGKDAAQIAAALEQARERVHLIALLDTLEYLRRGGRIPSAVGAVGELLAIKPVIAIVDGEVAILGKARGSKNGRNLLRQQIEKAGEIDFSMPVILGYTGLSDKLLRKYLADNRDLWEAHLGADNLPIHCIGATIGTHAGPNAVAVAYFSKE